ncbi:unnamed protein product [Caenorhabditis auriculariae]|uniref:Uncharacterized protein n=1 Tax=Caenorhabditis auriculariae TaxID=2777116 RepID=A0A8S1H9X0_9PELO|nr:unnamed protein product [Caenorhabditis auriculariae]
MSQEDDVSKEKARTESSEERDLGVGSSKKRRHEESAPIDFASTSSDDIHYHFPSWVAGGSPAQYVAPRELLAMATALENLELIHEIAVDENFKIPDVPTNPIEKAVKENMYKAFFDLLREDLAKQPPVYTNLLSHIMEIKMLILNDLLLPSHQRLREQIETMFDEERIKESLLEENFDFKQVAGQIIDILLRMCAPARDERIHELRKESDPIKILSGLFEMIELMKNDLTNYQLSKNRAEIENYSARYELREFQKLYTEYPDGPPKVREWICESYELMEKVEKTEEQEIQAKRERRDNEIDEQLLIDVTSKGFVTLVQSENPDPFPETLSLDRGRISRLSEKFLQIIITASSVLVTCGVAGRQIAESEDFKTTLKNHLIVIANDIDEKNLVEKLEAMGEQCAKEAHDTASKVDVVWDEDKTKAVKHQISALADEDNPVRAIVFKRVSEFVESILRSPTMVPNRLLPGLSIVQNELFAFTAKYLRLCEHNRRSYNSLYYEILYKIADDIVVEAASVSATVDAEEVKQDLDEVAEEAEGEFFDGSSNDAASSEDPQDVGLPDLL